MFTVAAKRSLYIALGLTAIAVWALVGFNPHSGLGPLTPVVAPVFVLLNSGITEDWPRGLFWSAIAAVVFSWVWLWAFLACLLTLHLSA
jgi:hypothetical protein